MCITMDHPSYSENSTKSILAVTFAKNYQSLLAGFLSVRP